MTILKTKLHTVDLDTFEYVHDLMPSLACLTHMDSPPVFSGLIHES